MRKKKKSWQEIKATKPIEEWRRINKVYGQRHKIKNQLKVKGAELMNQIHSYRLVQTPGPADALIDEVKKALRLPYSWNQEDYDHSVARLDEIAKDLRKIKQRITPKASELANILMMTVINSGDSEDVKATALISVVEYIAKQLSTNRVTAMEESKTNYVMSMLRTLDGYYPSWLPKYQFNLMVKLFSEKDLRYLKTQLDAGLNNIDKRNDLLSILDVEQEDEKEIR